MLSVRRFLPVLLWSWTVIALGLAGWLLTSPGQSPPAILVSELDIDFGDVEPPAMLKRTVTITNAGGQPLHLAGIKSSCGCTVAKPGRTRLPGGESTELTIEFAPPATFEASAIVTILSNDPKSPETFLTVSSRMPPKVFVSSEHVTLDAGMHPENRSVSLVYWNMPELFEPDNRIQAQCDDPAVLVEVQQDTPKRRAELFVQFTDELPAGISHRSLQLSDVHGHWRGAVECRIQKESLFFQPVSRKILAPRDGQAVVNVKLKSSADAVASPRISSAEVSGANPPFQLSFTEQAGVASLTLTEPATEAASPEDVWDGHVILHAELPGTNVTESFSIPVRWLTSDSPVVAASGG
jgi:hypothetical protein